MTIFKYELKRHKKYILGWAITLAVFILMMTPTYYSFMDVSQSSNELFETLGNNDFYKSVGVSMEHLTSPMGIYSFLTSFFMIASGIFGLHFGISIHTKEFEEKTSEYLYTKPHTRKEIFWAKAGTVFVGVVIVGVIYVIASWLAMVLSRPEGPWGEFFLVSMSLLWVTLLFAAMGMLVGTIFSNNRSPLLTAGLVILVEYCINSFSNIVSSKGISFLSPYSFFSGAKISQNGFYEIDYLIWYGDIERDDEAYKGHYFINANSTTAPQIVDRAVKPILDRGEVYSGCYARVSLNFYAFNSNGNKGIACGLGNIQKIRDGESLGGKTSAADDFGTVADDDFLA